VERLVGGSKPSVGVELFGSNIVLELAGRLTVEAEARLVDAISPWLPRLAGSLVMLDLRQVRQLDCAGIGQLVDLRNAVGLIGGTVVLVGVERRHMRLLQVVGLLTIFPVFDQREQALSWFHGTPGWAFRLPTHSGSRPSGAFTRTLRACELGGAGNWP
jgi:anti-anti-sigma factor